MFQIFSYNRVEIWFCPKFRPNFFYFSDHPNISKRLVVSLYMDNKIFGISIVLNSYQFWSYGCLSISEGGWGLISPHFAQPLWGLKCEMFKVHHFHWKGKGYYIGFMKKKIQISSPWLMAAAWRSASIYHILEKVQNQFFGSSSKICWHTPRVFCINIFLRCTPWLPVAILLFPKNAIIWFYSLMAHSPHGPRTPKQFKKIQ